MENYKCAICGLELKIEHKRAFLNHMRTHEELFQIVWPIKCGQKNCSKSFTSIKLYSTHLIQHSLELKKDENIKVNNSFVVKTSQSSFHEFDNEQNVHLEKTITELNFAAMEEDKIEPDDSDKSIDAIRNDIKNKAFKLINHFRAKNQISDVVLNEIIKLFGEFFNDLIYIIKDKTLELFDLNHENEKKLSELSELSEFYDVIVNPFEFLSSIYKQQNLLEESGFYIAPKSINIGKRDDSLMKNGILTVVSKDITFEYVSIYETLEVLLKNQEFYNSIQLFGANNCIDNNQKYYKSHKLYANKKNLRIILYYDDLEMCNALGDSAGIYKGGMFYFTVANLTRKHYSNPKNIFLVAVSHSEDLRSFGYNNVLQLIINDIKKLELTGIRIDQELFYGSLAQCIGDNLGIHQIFGMPQK